MSDENKQKDSKIPEEIAGYRSKELAKAPLEPPSPRRTESKEATKNPTVIFLVGLGVVLFLIGMVLILTGSLGWGFLVMVPGMISVAAAVFLPLK